MLACVAERFDPLGAARTQLRHQGGRIRALDADLDARGQVYESVRDGLYEMKGDLEELRRMAGHRKAVDNVAKATSAVLNLAAAFDHVDTNGSNGIDVSELEKGLAHHAARDVPHRHDQHRHPRAVDRARQPLR